MGQSFSSLSWKEIYENECIGSMDNAEEVTVRSISSFDRNEGEMTYRTVSFKRRNDSETNLKLDAPEEIIIEETISLKNSKSEKRKLNTTVSFKDLVLDTEKINSPNTSKRNDQNIMHGLKPTLSEPAVMFSPRPVSELDAAAVKLQKVYKSYRTRRNLADCAVVVEELWWKALDFAALKRSSVSFFNIEKPETAVSRWARARTRAAKVGKGLSKDEKAQKLALQHWLEAIDPRHRYGHNLHLYYDIWFDSESTQPFFYWLDVGDGKEVNLERCSRNDLLRNCIKYLGPIEREAYEVTVDSGRLVYKQSGMLVNTIEGSKWIFVLSTSRSLYVGQKKKGLFQHSSFLSGAATTAAGRLVAHNGILEAIWPYSGHYLPTEENFKEFISFLQDHYVDLTYVKRCATDDDYTPIKLNEVETKLEAVAVAVAVEASTITAASATDKKTYETVVNAQSRKKTTSTLHHHHHKDDMEINATNVDITTIDTSRRLKCDWSTGAGPRISCVRDYPTELQARALEQVNLSPRVMSGVIWNNGPIPSPRPSPKVRLSPRLTYMGLPSPRVSMPTAN